MTVNGHRVTVRKGKVTVTLRRATTLVLRVRPPKSAKRYRLTTWRLTAPKHGAVKVTRV